MRTRRVDSAPLDAKVVDLDGTGLAALRIGARMKRYAEYEQICERFGARYVESLHRRVCDARSLPLLERELLVHGIRLHVPPKLRALIPAGVPPGPAIYFRLHGEHVHVFISGACLDPASTTTFLRLCREFGLFYYEEHAAGVCRLTSPRLVPLMDELRGTGFALNVQNEIRDELTRQAGADEAALRDRQTHLAAIELELGRRNLQIFPFQRAGVEWLAGRRGALLADDMGLGKTMQALLAVPQGAAIIVVCPAIAKGVWQREADRWRSDLRVDMLAGQGSFRWPGPGELVVLNYEILPDADLAPCPNGVIVIGDEAHIIKNRKAHRTERFRRVATAALRATGRVWLLTATPLLNRAPEIWSILSAAELADDAFGSWDSFKRLFDAQTVKVGRRSITQWGQNISAEVPRRLERVMLRRTKLDVLPDIPAKRYQELLLPQLDEATRALCDEAEEVMARVGIRLRELEDLDDRVLDLILRAALGQLEHARAAVARWKTPHLVALVEQYEEQEVPLVVFSAHRHPIDVLGQRKGWAIITGDTEPEKRTAIAEAFQAGKLRGVAATIRAGGLAITLTAAWHCVFVDLDWTPALNRQAEDRLHRLGQDKSVLITYLIADNVVDARVTRALARKTVLLDQVFPGGPPEEHEPTDQTGQDTSGLPQRGALP